MLQACPRMTLGILNFHVLWLEWIVAGHWSRGLGIEVHCCSESESFNFWALERLQGLEDYQGSPRDPRQCQILWGISLVNLKFPALQHNTAPWTSPGPGCPDTKASWPSISLPPRLPQGGGEPGACLLLVTSEMVHWGAPVREPSGNVLGLGSGPLSLRAVFPFWASVSPSMQ